MSGKRFSHILIGHELEQAIPCDMTLQSAFQLMLSDSFSVGSILILLMKERLVELVALFWIICVV